MDAWDLPTSCHDVKSRRCEDLTSCDRSPALSFLSEELLLVRILMKRDHHREGRPCLVTGVQLSFLSGELLLVSILMKRGHHREGRP